MRHVLAALIVLGASFGLARAETSPPELLAGHDLALQICGYCHVTAADQQVAPILRPPAPPFRRIADKPGLTDEVLAHYLLGAHTRTGKRPGMPDPELNGDEVRLLIDYLLSLRNADPLAAPPPVKPAHAGSEASGRKLAVALCRFCHIIERSTAGSWTDAPPFPTIAARSAATETSLALFIQQPHLHMITLARPPGEAADLAAYILSLRQR